MSSFGVFGKDRREQLEALSWRWLLSEVESMKATELRSDNLYSRFNTLRRVEGMPWSEHGREFCHDLVEAALRMPRRHEEGSTVRLADEVRNRIAFQVLTGMFFEGGLPVGQPLVVLMARRTEVLQVNEKDAKDLVKMILRDLTTLALNGS